jgi:hypothetical protein
MPRAGTDDWRATLLGLLRLERGTDPTQFTLKLIAVALYGAALLLWALASHGAG